MAGRDNQEGLWLGTAAFLSWWRKQRQNYETHSLEADQRPLFLSLPFSKQPTQIIFFVSASSSSCCIQARNGRHSSGRPCRGKWTGETSVYSSLGEARTGKVCKCDFPRTLFFKAEACRRLAEGCRWRFTKVPSSAISPKYLPEKQIHPQLLLHYPNLSSGGFSSFLVAHSSRHLSQ